jgi:hypothetical protein
MTGTVLRHFLAVYRLVSYLVLDDMKISWLVVEFRHQLSCYPSTWVGLITPHSLGLWLGAVAFPQLRRLELAICFMLYRCHPIYISIIQYLKKRINKEIPIVSQRLATQIVAI